MIPKTLLDHHLHAQRSIYGLKKSFGANICRVNNVMQCNDGMQLYVYVPMYRADNLLKSMHVLGLLSDELLAV